MEMYVSLQHVFLKKATNFILKQQSKQVNKSDVA